MVDNTGRDDSANVLQKQIAETVSRAQDAERIQALCRLVESDVRNRRSQGQEPAAADYASLQLNEQDRLAIEAIIAGSIEAHSSTSVTTRTIGPPHPRRSASVDALPPALGRYRVERMVGAGAFGMVVAAWDAELERRVAVKIPYEKCSDERAEQHLDEARSAAKLGHRGIVAVHDCGRLPDGRFFIVSEFVEGGTLAQELTSGHPPLRRVVEVMIELADAIHHAHQRGLFHRDLKPQNILIDRGGHPRIADFGLSIDEARQSALAGDMSGTPAYMSPEQVRGESHFLDGRTDVWSLGVIFYELLTGRRPFRATKVEQLFEEILHRDPRPPRQMDDGIPRELETACLTCLQRPLAERYASAADLAEDLRVWLAEAELSNAALVDSKAASLRSARSASPALAAGTRAIDRRLRLGLVWTGALGLGALALLGAGIAFFGGRGGPHSTSAPSVVRAPAPGDEQPVKTVTGAAGISPLAYLGPANLPSGEWVPLLDEEPRVLQWPLVPRNSELTYRKSKREVAITCDQSAMAELGRTMSPNFRMRVRLHQPNWMGGVGVFWGCGEGDSADTLRYQALHLQQYRNSKKAKPIELCWTIGTCNREGWSLETTTLQRFDLSRPEGVDAELEFKIEQGLLREVRWIGQKLDDIGSLDPIKIPQPKDSVGALGIRVERSTVLARDAAIFFIP